MSASEGADRCWRWVACRPLPALLLLALGAWLTWVSWLRWPDLLVDYGRELYIAWRISAGEVLYRDISHVSGPLAQYLNAGLFALFGVGMRTLFVFNLLLVALLAWLVVALFGGLYDRFTGILCGSVFLGVFAFSQGRGTQSNFVTPYAHEVTYGIVLFFLAARLFLAAPAAPSRRRLAAAGLLLGLVFLTKFEVFFAAIAAAVPWLWHASDDPGQAGARRRGTFAFLTAALAAPLGFLVYFSAKTSLREGSELSLTGFRMLSTPIVKSPLYRLAAGLDDPAARLRALLEVAGVYLAFVVAAAGVAMAIAQVGSRRLRALLTVAGVLILVGLAVVLRERVPWHRAFLPFPLLIACYLPVLARRAADGGQSPGRRTALHRLGMALFAMVLLVRIVLRVVAASYGVALAMPAGLLVTALLVHEIPELIGRRGGDRAVARILLATMVVITIAVHVGAYRQAYSTRSYPVGTGADRFYAYAPEVDERGPVLNQVLAYLAGATAETAGVAVLPEGVIINYLSRRRNPSGFFDFTPTYLSAVSEERSLAALQARPPDYVLVTDRPTPEHGATYFGLDYGLKLRDWITRGYRPVAHFGYPVLSGEGFGVVVAERRPE